MKQSAKWTARAMVPVFVAALVLAGCETKQGTGTLVGAGAGAGVGALFGSGSGKVWAIAGGAVVGGFVGNRVGKNMDDKDKREAQKAARKAETAPVGEKIAWENPDSGNKGELTVVQEGTDADGNQCRKFEHTVVVDGETETTTGAVCKRPDGQWVTIRDE